MGCRLSFPRGPRPLSRAIVACVALTFASAGCGDKDGKKKHEAMGGGPGTTRPDGSPGMEGAPGMEGGPAAPGAPPVEVVTAPVSQRDVPVVLEFVGQTAGFQDIEIRARVEGHLMSQDFVEGKPVKAGDLLYTIDPAEFEQKVAQADGELAAAAALLDRASREVKRYAALLPSGAVSGKEYDTSVTAEKNAEGKVTAAKAVLEQAKLDLSYTKITAPAAGLVGQTKVNVGNLVGRGESTLLTTVSVIDPIKVRLSIKEPDFLRLARKRAQDIKEGEALPKRVFDMTLADGTVYPQQGELLSVDRAVDQATGTLGFEVKFPNPDQILRPGAFAKLKANADVQKGALIVPQRALSLVQGQSFVAVVGPENRVELRRVKPGIKIGSEWVIEEGLKPGETVIVEGVQKVKDGTVVVTKATGADPAPAPAPGAMGDGK